MYHQEYKYLSLIKHVLQRGELIKGRNGNVLSTFGYTMRYNLRNNTFPLLTTKKMAWKTCINELLWFLRGDTDNRILKSKNIHIWNGNGTRSFLDSRGLFHYKEDDLGPIYGFQWRNFGGDYISCDKKYDKNGVDQLQHVINQLSNPQTRNSRRLIVSAWNPLQLHLMALPPCHVLFQFHVNQKEELSCSLYQRSGDVGLGVPFNIASYSALTILLAKHCGLLPGMFIHNLGDVHIYENHIKPLEEQMNRNPYKSPTLHIKQKKDCIDDYEIDDFILNDYFHHPKIKMDMIV